MHYKILINMLREKVFKKCRGTWKVLLSCVIIVLLFMEWLEYALSPVFWPRFPSGFKDSIRILVVGDPQLLGYSFSGPGILGYICRWDADRYVSKTFSYAYHYVKPNIVVFLGDNLDEGEIANDEEFLDYIKRFRYVFQEVDFHKPSISRMECPLNWWKANSEKFTRLAKLARKYPLAPASTVYREHYFLKLAIIIPGDNDIGGEDEPPSPQLEKRFNKYFRKDVFLRFKFLEFVKVNYITHSNEYLQAPNITENTFRIILSHIPLTTLYSTFVSRVVPYLMPHIILSSHDHKTGHWVSKRHTGMSTSAITQFDSDFFYFNISESHLHEIIVPTCSYRMGTNKMGYGALELSPDGKALFSVLWLPHRFRQLFIYLFCAICISLYLLFIFSRACCRLILYHGMKHQRSHLLI